MPLNDDYLTHMRKPPRSKRGQQRVDKILDAAADLLIEVGYADLTTNAIADRAETSIGSLYQFFNNKDNVLEALANRYHTHLNTMLDHKFNTLHGRTLSDVMLAYFRGAKLFFDANPAFSVLFFGSTKTEGLAAMAAEAYASMVARVDGILAHYHPHMPTDQRTVQAYLLVSLMKLQLPWLATLPEHMQPAMMAEIEAMMQAHLDQLT